VRRPAYRAAWSDFAAYLAARRRISAEIDGPIAVARRAGIGGSARPGRLVRAELGGRGPPGERGA